MLKARSQLPDLIILDLMLPTMDGLSVCREIRSDMRARKIPILMLTAKSEETDQIVGFSMGADDYVTKPFSVKVLMQRVKALLRRSSESNQMDDVLQHLDCLIRQRGRALTRYQLIDNAIGYGAIVLERTIDVHIKTLRRKLGEKGDLIETVRGVGYRISERAEEDERTRTEN